MISLSELNEAPIPWPMKRFVMWAFYPFFYRRAFAARVRSHPFESALTPQQQDTIKAVRRDGYATLRGLIDKSHLETLRMQVDDYIDTIGQTQKPLVAFRDWERQGGRGEPMTLAEMSRGQEVLKDQTKWVQIPHLMANLTAIVPLAVHEELIEIAAGYFGCLPLLGYCDFRKSYANSIPPLGTNFFHTDNNSPNFLKFFIYFNDVESDNGPTTYIKGSHKKRHAGSSRKSEWTAEEMAQRYAADRFIELTSSVGDVHMVNPTGYHCGKPLQTGSRYFFEAMYILHPSHFSSTRYYYDIDLRSHHLSRRQRAVLQLFERV